MHHPNRGHFLAARFGLDEGDDLLNEFEALGIHERAGLERIMNNERLAHL